MPPANVEFVQGKPLLKLMSFTLLFASNWCSVTAVERVRKWSTSDGGNLPTVSDDGAEYGAFLEAPQRQLLQDNSSVLCYRGQVQCPSGIAECFDAHANACNGVNDCSDGSDEAPAFCANYTCPIYTGKCPSYVCTTTYPNAPHSTRSPFVCDGIKDCPDNSDEDPSFCATYNCSAERALACPGGKQCIQSYSRVYNGVYGGSTPICDGLKDCSDGSDEDPALCSSYVCPNNAFKCNNICIPRSKVCNGQLDCADGSDEDTGLCGPSYNCSLVGFGIYGFQHCPSGIGCYPVPNGPINCGGSHYCLDGSDAPDPSLCANATCGFLEVKCPSGVGCMLNGSLCDGIYDCADKSDERADVCANHTCRADSIKCPSGNGGCLYPGMICDGQQNNCLDGSDETDATCRTYDCGPDRTRCPSGTGCVTPFDLCDGIPKNGASICKDGSDEDPAFCTSQGQCPGYSQRIRCRNGTCVDGELCDGKASCADGSDEDTSYCKSASCPYAEQKCADGIHCVSQPYGLCNGKADCPDGSDESVSVCATYNCTYVYKTKCPGGSGQCIDNNNLCDGVVDCTDGSDESAPFCASFNCAPKSFKCPGTNVCVYGALCDGHPDCPDHSDESQAVCNSALSPTPNPVPAATPPVTASPPQSPGTPPPVTASPPQSPGTPPPVTASPSQSPGTPPPVTASPAQSPGTPPPVTASPSQSPGTPQPTNANPPESPGAPHPANSEPAATPPVTASPSQSPSVTPCDPSSSLPNQCFNAPGTASICCPGQCPNTPGDAPACGASGPSPPTCDPTSSNPNQCFNANGDQSVCCPGSCPGSPGPVAKCG